MCRNVLALSAILLLGCGSKDSDKVEALSTTSLSEQNFLLTQFLSNQHTPHITTALDGTVTLSDEEGKLVKLTGDDNLKLVAASGEAYPFSNKPTTNLGATPLHCCAISTELPADLPSAQSFEIKLSRNDSAISFGTLTLPKFVEFIYPSTEQDIKAISLNTNQLTLSWQPETDEDLQSIRLTLMASEKNKPCPANKYQRWVKPSQGNEQQAEDKLYSELDYQLNINLVPLFECEKPWRVQVAFDYHNGHSAQQLFDFSKPN
ncbi:hypothetical protein [Pseudoalteromonas luteoviolacea]|uniref:hypothetical protein n=1 Tax=Pseudoalteromonas luteoviolacea TaxID=43657 RepID=UPI0011549594|nr:hypothetical protein [Pseudoalteromonas luteoviolacea]TQF72365.1 hypothetical protein FLM44_15500 [Pseudoalteromonas luteoviolacea]